MTDLFDERLSGEDKVTKLKDDYGLPVTRDYEEVFDMCTYADAIENKARKENSEIIERQKNIIDGLRKEMADLQSQMADLRKQVSERKGT